MRATDPEQRKRAEAEHQSLGRLQVVAADVRNPTQTGRSRICAEISEILWRPMGVIWKRIYETDSDS